MDRINASSGELSGGVNEYINGMRLIKAYGMSSTSFQKYASGIDKQYKLRGDISRATTGTGACKPYDCRSCVGGLGDKLKRIPIGLFAKLANDGKYAAMWKASAALQ